MISITITITINVLLLLLPPFILVIFHGYVSHNQRVIILLTMGIINKTVSWLIPMLKFYD